MNKITNSIITLAFILSASQYGVMAGEHPNEHPSEHPTKQSSEHPGEHPTKHSEHPSKHKKKKKFSKNKKFQKNFEKVVKNYLKAEGKKTGGHYTIQDDVLDKTWKLKLLRVHRKKICMLDQGKNCFACADFKEVGGKNKLDLDFYASRDEDGNIEIEKVIIHKLNGKPRFTYNDENEMVPVE